MAKIGPKPRRAATSPELLARLEAELRSLAAESRSWHRIVDRLNDLDPDRLHVWTVSEVQGWTNELGIEKKHSFPGSQTGQTVVNAGKLRKAHFVEPETARPLLAYPRAPGMAAYEAAQRAKRRALLNDWRWKGPAMPDPTHEDTQICVCEAIN